MATYYVYSGATGAGTGADWANAYTTLTSALASKAAGDVFYVADDHAESTAAAITLTMPGTISSPCWVLCVNRAGSVPPVSADLKTTAVVATSGASTITITGGYAFLRGINFQAGSGSSTASLILGSNGTYFYKKCSFALNASGSSLSQISLGSGNPAQYLRFEECDFKFTNTAQKIIGAGIVRIIGGSIAATGSIPSTMFSSVSTALDMIGVDISAAGSGKTIFSTQSTQFNVRLENCKLGASVTLASAPTLYGSQIVFIANDSAGNNYRFEKYAISGTETTETTVVRTGGASNGTTALARKIVTTSSASGSFPFESEPLALWQDTTGSSKTITIYGIWGGASVPNNDDIWIEVRHMGSSTTPVATITSNTKADILATGSALDSDSSSWGGSTTAFKMSVSVTPQLKGPLYVVVKAAKASSTFYYDPLISVT